MAKAANSSTAKIPASGSWTQGRLRLTLSEQGLTVQKEGKSYTIPREHLTQSILNLYGYDKPKGGKKGKESGTGLDENVRMALKGGEPGAGISRFTIYDDKNKNLPVTEVTYVSKGNLYRVFVPGKHDFASAFFTLLASKQESDKIPNFVVIGVSHHRLGEISAYTEKTGTVRKRWKADYGDIEYHAKGRKDEVLRWLEVLGTTIRKPQKNPQPGVLRSSGGTGTDAGLKPLPAKSRTGKSEDAENMDEVLSGIRAEWGTQGRDKDYEGIPKDESDFDEASKASAAFENALKNAGSASGLKKAVVENLYDALKNNRDFMKFAKEHAYNLDSNGQYVADSPPMYEEKIAKDAPLEKRTRLLIAGLIQSWAITAGGDEGGEDEWHWSFVLQRVIGDTFKTHPKRALSDESSRVKKKAAQVLRNRTIANGIKAFVLEQYRQTQQNLKRMGISEMIVYRGIYTYRGGLDFAIGNVQNILEKKLFCVADITGRPLSSWSSSPAVAAGFGNIVMMQKVPAKYIFSTPLTGFGCAGEKEVTVLTPEKGFRAVLTLFEEDMKWRRDRMAALFRKAVSDPNLHSKKYALV